MMFTQFKFPNATVIPNEIAMPEEIERLAKELRDAGWSFEIEVFPDSQVVHADCCDEEEAIADESSHNGPVVPAMVEKLVRSAHEAWTNLGRPRAKGGRLDRLDRRMQAQAGI